MKKYHLKSSDSFKPSIDYSSDLNPEQLEAVTSDDGAALVIAGAGSGKTRVVTYRVAYLIEKGVDPSRIMLLTFTNKASREMLQRVELLIKGESRKVWGGTFHSIGNMILRKYGKAIDLAPDFTILDREDSKDLIESSVAEMKLRKDKMFPKANVLINVISYATGTERSVIEEIEENYAHLFVYCDEIEKVKNRYEAKKREMKLVDFDDLLFLWKKLLVDVPAIREKLSEKFLHMLVDEYQDTNRIQSEIVDLMTSKHNNIMVVGDDSQAIYSFRGACFDNIIEFPDRYHNARTFKLTTNYRSTDEILGLANESIAFNSRQFPKTLNALNRKGPLPALVPLKNTGQQAEFISQRILDLVDEGLPMKEIAILYRSHFQSMDLQMELTRRRIPYEVRSGMRFFEQAHIKDVVSYLRAILNPMDEISWTRILKLTPGIGGVTARKIWDMVKSSVRPVETIMSKEILNVIPKRGIENWAAFRENFSGLEEDNVQSSPSETIRLVLKNGYDSYLQGTFENYDERKEDIEQLANYSNNFKSTGEFLSDLALLTNIQSEDIVNGGEEEGDAIVLSTVHRAKGLEWSRVFIIGLADGSFPSAKSMGDLESEEEERRVFYVAITRAKDELYLCYPIMDNRWYDGSVIKRPSPFIQELPEYTYEKWEIEY
ncbi:DNA helicase II [bacterium BMS3Abin09]|nr:DNA helicase II [bacterium BMS3Abin09]GBE41720.1 DNA helicase II [bacterium BMS3Bbin09]